VPTAPPRSQQRPRCTDPWLGPRRRTGFGAGGHHCRRRLTLAALESAASSARACRIAADLANWVAEHMPELSAKPGKTPASSRPLVRHQWRVRWRSPAAGARAQLESDWRPPLCCPEAALARSVMTPHQLDVARATITSGPLLVERSRVSLAGPAGASRRAVGRVSHPGLCPCSRPEARRSVRCPC
jgi:hypothetical protein